MYDILKAFKWKPNPKFQEKLINFEKPQKFPKIPKPKIQNMKCMRKERKMNILGDGNQGKIENDEDLKIWVRETCLGGEKSLDRSREIDRMRGKSRSALL